MPFIRIKLKINLRILGFPGGRRYIACNFMMQWLFINPIK